LVLGFALFPSSLFCSSSSPLLLDPLLELAPEVAEAGVEEVELVVRLDMDLGMYGFGYGEGLSGGSAGGYNKPLVMGVGMALVTVRVLVSGTLEDTARAAEAAVLARKYCETISNKKYQ
ncbi:hypothetical protein GW17_00032739, partial [Ensete ventricosum]